MSAKSVMIVGTMSNSGKSFITAGLCRIFRQDGFKTAPFKSQNMALNSYITKDGLEMGRAQVMQAESAKIEPDIRMNPILLKPTSEKGSQVIVNGEVYENMNAKEYYSRKYDMIPYIMKAYNSLSDEYDIIVLEGAGSPAEINLKDVDIVNMGMAEISNSPVILVGDIDRGGVFASVYGTIALLDENERKRMKGIIINKFRGDVSILKNGLDMIENLTGVPVLGVVPYIDIDIDDEDSLSDKLLKKNIKSGAVIDIAVIRFPKISNFTDFDVFSRIDGVSLRYVTKTSEFGNPDMVLLAGTKNTMADLKWIRQNGIEAKILKHHSMGGIVAGICGGYQMLGNEIIDYDNIEEGGSIRGMELLDVSTVFQSYKHCTRTNGNICSLNGELSVLSGKYVSGYEIHMGETHGNALPFVRLENGDINGYISADGTVFGTYLHGFFDTYDTAQEIVKILMKRKGIAFNSVNSFSPEEYKDIQYDKLADCLRENLDIKKIYEIINDWEKNSI
jgi:adenosylcobyric acid synthase